MRNQFVTAARSTIDCQAALLLTVSRTNYHIRAASVKDTMFTVSRLSRSFTLLLTSCCRSSHKFASFSFGRFSIFAFVLAEPRVSPNKKNRAASSYSHNYESLLSLLLKVSVSLVNSSTIHSPLPCHSRRSRPEDDGEPPTRRSEGSTTPTPSSLLVLLLLTTFCAAVGRGYETAVSVGTER